MDSSEPIAGSEVAAQKPSQQPHDENDGQDRQGLGQPPASAAARRFQRDLPGAEQSLFEGAHGGLVGRLGMIPAATWSVPWVTSRSSSSADDQWTSPVW